MSLQFVKFDSLPVGSRCRLENTFGIKVTPIADKVSRAFYAEHGVGFWGWNFTYRYYAGDGEWRNGHFSIAPNEDVVLLPPLAEPHQRRQ